MYILLVHLFKHVFQCGFIVGLLGHSRNQRMIVKHLWIKGNNGNMQYYCKRVKMYLHLLQFTNGKCVSAANVTSSDVFNGLPVADLESRIQ